MKVSAVRMMQQSLMKEGYNVGQVDGALGEKTYAAVNLALTTRSTDLPGNWQAWPDKRKSVAYVQLLCKAQAIEVGVIDGCWGPQTDYAFDTLAYLLTHGEMPRPWRDEVPLNLNPHQWPNQAEAELLRCYGPVGQNQATLQLPYPHRLAWESRKVVRSFPCHEKVHDSLVRILGRVLDHYGPDRIRELRLDQWGGCLNVRKMRGGSQWSMHAWGVAVDYDPGQNQLKWGRDRAGFARPEYDVWWRLWEEEGWVSLGRHKNYDWMHVQAAKI